MGCEYLSMELREREVLEYCEHEQFLLGQVNFELLRCHVITFTLTGDPEVDHLHCRHSPLCKQCSGETTVATHDGAWQCALC